MSFFYDINVKSRPNCLVVRCNAVKKITNKSMRSTFVLNLATKLTILILLCFLSFFFFFNGFLDSLLDYVAAGVLTKLAFLE